MAAQHVKLFLSVNNLSPVAIYSGKKYAGPQHIVSALRSVFYVI